MSALEFPQQYHLRVGQGQKRMRTVAAQIYSCASQGKNAPRGDSLFLSNIETLLKSQIWPEGKKPDIVFFPEYTINLNSIMAHLWLETLATKYGITLGVGISRDLQDGSNNFSYFIFRPDGTKQHFLKKYGLYADRNGSSGYHQFNLNGFSFVVSICRDAKDTQVQEAMESLCPNTDLFIVPVFGLNYSPHALAKHVGDNSYLFVNQADLYDASRQSGSEQTYSQFHSCKGKTQQDQELNYQQGLIIIDLYKD